MPTGGRSPTLWAADASLWGAALLVATVLRYEFAPSLPRPGTALLLVLVTAAVLGLAGAFSGVYTGRWRVGSLDEMRALGWTVAVAVAAAVVADIALGRPLPLSAPLAAGPMLLVAVAVVRCALRLRSEAVETPDEDANRLIIFGAGDGADRVIAAMQRTRCPYVPVALLDDDPRKRRLRLRGIMVRGDRTALSTVAAATGANTLLIAIPSADAALIRELADLAHEAGMKTRVLPAVSELFERDIAVTDIRPVSYGDLLGRHEVEIDIESMASYIAARRILVTGAGGSIGSELCRQIHRLAPASLVLLDRDESALHGVELSLTGRAMLDSRDLVVADIRDRGRMEAVFDEHKPDIVFHAAALKHLPLLEMHPDEAVKTNVWGTWNVLEAAHRSGVQRFVNISTDKAADPISVLGYTKRIAERLTAWFGLKGDGRYLSVRFGNVLGSRGSVLTAFEAQIACGGPVTVTDPEVSRYFMTIEEAVLLVLQAGAIGGDGEALVLDMGQPVRIADVARRLIDDSGSAAAIVYTGLRPGEKMHEVLLATGEPDRRPVHPLISHVTVPPLSPAAVRGVDLREPRDEIVSWCRAKITDAPQAVFSSPEHGSPSTTIDLRRPKSQSRRTTDSIGSRADA